MFYEKLAKAGRTSTTKYLLPQSPTILPQFCGSFIVTISDLLEQISSFLPSLISRFLQSPFISLIQPELLTFLRFLCIISPSFHHHLSSFGPFSGNLLPLPLYSEDSQVPFLSIPFFDPISCNPSIFPIPTHSLRHIQIPIPAFWYQHS